jgi:hypothetical protein
VLPRLKGPVFCLKLMPHDGVRDPPPISSLLLFLPRQGFEPDQNNNSEGKRVNRKGSILGGGGGVIKKGV